MSQPSEGAAASAVMTGVVTVLAVFGLLGLFSDFRVGLIGLIVGLVVAALIGTSRHWARRGGAGLWKFTALALAVSAVLYWPLALAL